MLQNHPSFYRLQENILPVAPSHSRIVIDHSNSHEKCGCKKKEKSSLADFMVNVPCPKTTTKAPRKVVVKVPCPTTEKPSKAEKCACKCCPCNPCENKKKKKPTKKESCSSESKEEVKTIVRSYKPSPKKSHNEVRHPYHVHRIHLEKSSEEDHKPNERRHGDINHHRIHHYNESDE